MTTLAGPARAVAQPPAAPPPGVGDVAPVPRRWTREEYYRLGEQGFFEGQRVELIEGEIVQMSPQGSPHSVAIGLVERALRASFGDACWLRIQMPVLAGTSEPEPDVAVVPGSPRDYKEHPQRPLLVVEVSDTTLAFDRRAKASLYARMGIADYWVVNLIDRVVEVFREPVEDAAERFGWRYRLRRTYTPGERIQPVHAGTGEVLVDDTLP